MDTSTLEGIAIGVALAIGCLLWFMGLSGTRPSEVVDPDKPVEPTPLSQNPTPLPDESDIDASIESRVPEVTDSRPTLQPEILMSYRAYSLQRIGDNPSDNCDSVDADDTSLRFAISDGASQSYDSRLWSQLLTKAWVTKLGHPSLEEISAECAAKWHETTSHDVAKIPNNELLRIKMQAGSSATFGGLRWVEDVRTNGYWEAVIVGDVLLIVTKQDSAGRTTVSSTAPFLNLSDFPTSPDQLRTSFPHLARKSTTIHLKHTDDIGFVLLTDALARYAISSCTRGAELSSVFPFLADDGLDFSTWIDQLRASGLIEDDDCSILIVQVASKPESRG